MKHLFLLIPLLLPVSLCWAGQSGNALYADKITEICRTDLHRGAPIGGGSFGQVYEGTWQGRQVAIKTLPRSTISSEGFKQEAQLVWKCQSPYIVKLYGLCTEPGQEAMVFERMDGTLDMHLDDLTYEQKWRIAMDIAEGLAYLHDKEIFHLDLKSPNILLTKDRRAKISDFGLSKSRADTLARANMRPFERTIAWSAPELFSDTENHAPANNIYSSTADIYSYGMILWGLVSQRKPFDGSDYEEIRRKKFIKENETIPDGFNPVMAEIITDCWKGADQRPSALDILERFDNENPRIKSMKKKLDTLNQHIEDLQIEQDQLKQQLSSQHQRTVQEKDDRIQASERRVAEWTASQKKYDMPMGEFSRQRSRQSRPPADGYDAPPSADKREGGGVRLPTYTLKKRGCQASTEAPARAE